MATWPTSLPTAPLAGSLSFSSDPNIAEFRPEVGGPIRRRRYTAARQTLSATVELDGGQIETLRSFYRDELQDGVLPFDMLDWWNLTHGAPTIREFRFEELPTFTHHAVDRYRVSIVLSTMV